MFCAVRSSIAGLSVKPGVADKKINTLGKLGIAAITIDALAFITSLIIGILAITGTGGLPPSTPATCFTIGSLILVAWMIGSCCSRGKMLSDAAILLKAAVSSDPKIPTTIFS